MAKVEQGNERASVSNKDPLSGLFKDIDLLEAVVRLFGTKVVNTEDGMIGLINKEQEDTGNVTGV